MLLFQIIELLYIHYTTAKPSLEGVKDAFLQGYISWAEVKEHTALIKVEVNGWLNMSHSSQYCILYQQPHHIFSYLITKMHKTHFFLYYFMYQSMCVHVFI